MSEVIRKEMNNEGSVLLGKNNSDESTNKLLLATSNFPHYGSYEARLDSYDSCSITVKQKPQDLSEAGFFYLGHDDRTVCFHCGGGLNEWKEFDDPWIEHAYWFPRCQFILTLKGADFVNNAGSKKHELEMSRNKKKTETRNYLSLIDTKHSKKANTPSRPINKDDSLNSSNVEGSDDSPMLCKICFLYEKNILYLPCRHIVACSKCSSGLSECPVCREPILNSIKVYHS